MFEFYFNTKVIFGIGSRSSLTGIISGNKWRRIGVVVDANLGGAQIINNLLDDLEGTTSFLLKAHCRISEPTYNSLEEMRPSFSGQHLDAIVGIGGGSALDMAKGMAVLVNNPKPAIHYRGFDKMTEPVLPVVAMATTAGTGSEITPNASFIDSVEKRKLGINGEAVRPRYALLDPELTLSCPRRATISAGVDSIVHGVEAFAAKKSNPMVRMFAKEGVTRVFQNLAQVVKDPENVTCREQVMYGAFLSAIALMNSGTGPAAAMSYPLGTNYGVPHGIAGGIFLPHVIRHNIEQGCYKYSGLYDGLHPGDSTGDDEDNARRFLEEMSRLWEELSMPNDLAQFGVGREAISVFIKQTMELKAALDQNPFPFYEKEIEDVLDQLV
ncbi:MAG: iron-containing alcohol dehydrogenase [Thermodesulfobacteriota bacterium]